MNYKLPLLMITMAVAISSCKPKQEPKIETMTEVKTMHPEWSKHSNIYEVNIRQYTPEGTFKAFEQHLERLSKMGVDILWLMPISPIGEKNRKGSLGSYYAIKDYTSVNPEYGSLADLQSLVKKAHQLGMHVIIDWVANHTAWDHPWVTEHPDWYQKDSTGALASPYDWTDVVALDYNNKEVWKAMGDAMLYWVDSADIDGFRCDVAMLVHTAFWDSLRMELDQKKPMFMLAEAELPEHHLKAFDMSYAWELHHRMEDIYKGKIGINGLHKQITDDLDKFGTDAYRMQFTTNHDENSWNGTEYEKFGNLAECFAVLTYTIPGMPLIYSGQEAENKDRLRFFDKDTIDFTKVPLSDFYLKLAQLKNANTALWNGNFGGNYQKIESNNSEKIMSFIREKEGNKVIYVANLSTEELSFQLNIGIHAGTYTDYFQNQKTELKSSQELKLKAGEYRVYVQ